jgi:hypothetical protein
MQHRILILKLLCAVVLLIGCGTGAYAQTLELLNPPNSGYIEGGVYTSPYNISVNGSAMQLICDDFTTDISIGESWDATVTTLTTIDTGTVANLKFASSTYNGNILGGAGDVVQDYAIAAVLAGELLSLPSSDSADAGALSFAIWDVFDSTLLGSSCASQNDPYGSLSCGPPNDPNGPSGEWGAAYADLQNAISEVNSVMLGGSVNLANLGIASLTVYTGDPAGVAQEFLQVSMPEPSSPVVLGLDLLGVAGLVWFVRRRAGSAVTARS